MKKIMIVALFYAFLFSLSMKQAVAIYNPLTLPNNKIGIHILAPEELKSAQELVNTHGDWGYVTIPIQAGDKDLVKWQTFMDNCRTLHLIPIIRLATEGDYFNNATWRKPKDSDTIDFVNFLNSLNWPVKNRYVVIYNEVNRGSEWEGKADPAEYAQILTYAVTVFKSVNKDFFIISSGMDNAAATDGTSYNEYDYFSLMDQGVRGVFSQVDGISSHSYPNPGFSQTPSTNTTKSISSFVYESDSISRLTSKKLPIFITETGWDQQKISENTVSSYFSEALSTQWNDPRIIAITPFVLNAGTPPFQNFSFTNKNGDKNEIFKTIEGLSKTRGRPMLSPVKRVLGSQEDKASLPVRDFSKEKEDPKVRTIKTVLKWILI